MAFIGRYVGNACLPQTRGDKIFIRAPKTFYFEAYRVYRIDLGLWLPYLPLHTVVKLIDIHPRFTLLNHFWTASSDDLRLLILTHSTTILEKEADLCQIQYVSTASLIPGNKFL